MTEININEIIEIAKKAGKEILEIYNQKDIETTYKEDKSPLTEADKSSHKIISKSLKELYPEIPVLSEEGKNIEYEKRKDWKEFWLIDPLDGTKEFLKKSGEFTINIALIKNQEPVLGVVYVPVKNILYYTSENKSYKIEDNKTIELPVKENKEKDTLIVVASKSHFNEETKNFIEKLKEKNKIEFTSAGSSLKLCLVAEGKADIYPRLGLTMEWDTAAAHAILKNSGKDVYDFQNKQPLKYNKKDLHNPYFIVE